MNLNLSLNPRKWPIIRELIGRMGSLIISTRRQYGLRVTQDLTRPDAAFWDRARRGEIAGLEISGLLLKPLQSKVATWVMGKTLQFRFENPRNQEALNEWWEEHHSEILFAFEESVGLGNYFLVINPDLSVTSVSDDVVDPIVDEDDYSKIIGWKITQRFQHPTEIGRYMVEINEYTASERVRRVQFEKGQEQIERFPNLIGICPVVHIANNRMSNEVWGQPEGAALVARKNGLLHRYGEILDAGLEGNIKQGRPTPTINFKDMAGFKAFKDSFGRTETDPVTGRPVTSIEFDSDKLMAVTGDFKYAQPGSFAGDTEKLLSILYWLMLEHIEIPEFVMGTAIASSKASTETQMPIFVKWIEKKRGQVAGWVVQVATIVNALQALMVAGVTQEKPSIQWNELTNEDGKLTLEYIKWAYAEGLIDKKTALMLGPKKIEDVDAVLKQAAEERANPEVQRDLNFRDNLQNDSGAATADDELANAA